MRKCDGWKMDLGLVGRMVKGCCFDCWVGMIEVMFWGGKLGLRGMDS